MLLLYALLACEGRQPLTFPVSAAPAPATASPWRLDEASVTFTDLRLNTPGPTAGLTLLPTAIAHPGHNDDGGPTAELLGTFTVDLLGGEVLLGEAHAWEGPVDTARLQVESVRLAGTVGDRPFRFELPIEHDVAGIPLFATLDADRPPGHLLVRVDPASMLAFADPDTPDDDDDGALTTADGALANTVRFGILSVDSWPLELRW